MRVWLVASTLVLGACATVAGIEDLEVGQRDDSSLHDRGDAAPDLGEGETDAGSGPELDATRPPPPPPKDASVDTTPEICTLPANETFTTAPAKTWVPLGSTAFANPGIRLTDNVQSQAGAFWWDEARTFDKLEITFSYTITATGLGLGPGDGLALAWVASPTVPGLGGTGGAMAVMGQKGWAVAVDTYQNPEFSDPAVPNISIKKTDDMTNLAATAANATLIDGKEHTVRVRLADGSVTVALDGTDVLGPTAIPSYAPYQGYFGFGAGTGGAQEAHVLTGLTARIGTTGACAAP